jgi:putative nucleotidyltransferase with HDIG domain
MIVMRFSTRTFLSSFLPFAFLLTVSFWLIKHSVLSTVRDGLRASLRETHASVARVQSKSVLHNNRFLRVLGENATLKAGLQLVRAEPDNAAARLTLVDQLRELSETLGFDLLVLSNPDGQTLGGVIRSGSEWRPLDTVLKSPVKSWPREHGFLPIPDRTFQLTSVPVNLGDENVGLLTVGEIFDFSEFSTPTVLSNAGKVMQSSIPDVPPEELQAALLTCAGGRECEVRLHGTSYLSLPVETLSLGDGYVLRSFQDVDAASGPVQNILTRVFLVAGGGALLAALVLSAFSTRTIVEPLAAVVRHLRESENTHVLPEFAALPSSISEIRELTTSFNRAASSIREGRDFLRRAYIGFVGSLASALDARDPYTSGHSHRVSNMATATARIMQLPAREVEIIRIGALLHDIGKIGVPDAVLQKPGPLTEEEFDLIKQHPAIGRRILEPVGGFEDYLPIVELHHENWDGSGYPHRLKGEAVPIGARIVHVVDAYDAITTDRPYRPGMSHVKAVELLRKFSGTQFDGAAVSAFLETAAGRQDESGVESYNLSVQNLAAALASSSTAPVVLEQRT